MLLAVLATYHRLSYGVDFTDEAFYLAIPYHFLLGGTPFVDEINILQLQTLLILPLVKLYYQATGSIDGIVLFARYVYLAFSLLVAGITFLFIRKFVAQPAAVLISLSCVAFIPLNIPAPSYNTLGMGFFTMGCMFGAWAVANQKRLSVVALSGVAHGLAVISYPTLAIPSLVFIAILSALRPMDKLRLLLAYVIGAALPFALIAPDVIRAGAGSVLISLTYSSSFGLRDSRNALLVFSQIFNNKLAIILFLLSFALIYRRRPTLAAYVVLFLPVFVFLIQGSNPTYVSSNWYIISYGLMAPLLLVFIGGKEKVRQMFFAVWVPSFVAGLIAASSSGNGAISAAVGLFPASIVTSVFVVLTFVDISSRYPKGEKYSVNHLWLAVPPVLVASFLVIYQFGALYRDDRVKELDTQIKTGAYAGLFTTREKNDFMTNLCNDISALSMPSDTVLFYDRFPAGYLLTSMSPATNTMWLFQVADYQPNLDRSGLLQYYSSKNRFPDLAIKMKHVPYTRNEVNNLVYPSGDLLNNMIEGPQYRVVLSRDNYTIFRKVKANPDIS